MADVFKEVDALAGPESLPAVRDITGPDSLCAMLGGLLRLALAVAAVLALLAGAAELGLRAAGAKPGGSAALANTVPDGWTGFRLRPQVTGQEIDVTNDLGMHAPRSYALARPAGAVRVAVLGSSVVYGLGVTFAQTIPGAIERELEAGGHPAEVLNFGTHAFSIVNLSALLQAYVHQFHPQVVVVVVDLQVGLPRWPSVHPASAGREAGIGELNWWETLLERGSPKSALLAAFQDPRPARRWIRRTTGLPLKPRGRATPGPEPDAVRPAPAAVVAPGPNPSAPESARSYEARRESDLAAPLAAMAAFCAEKSITLYFVTPYGPYFELTEDELARMSVHHFLEEATRLRGDERTALGAEVDLITRVVRRVVAAHGSARVIDMLESSRRASLQTSRDFTEDGVHLSPTGNEALGKLIAARIGLDLDRRSVAQD